MLQEKVRLLFMSTPNDHTIEEEIKPSTDSSKAAKADGKANRLLEWIRKITPAVTIMALIVGGGWFLIETFIIKPQRQREERVLSYVSELRHGEFFEAYYKLQTFWNTRKETKDTPPECYPKLAAEMLERVNHSKEINILLMLYDEISKCVIEGMCDKELACKWFGSKIYGFSFFYREVLREWGTPTQPLNASMSKFAIAKEFCGIQPVPGTDKPCKDIR
jgi:hypothetical protein